jgi:hypothetical protein
MLLNTQNQLKATRKKSHISNEAHTVRKEHFNLSDLKDTIEGFAKRYFQHYCGDNKTPNSPKVLFNCYYRPISDSFKRNILTIGKGGPVNTRFQTPLKSTQFER